MARPSTRPVHPRELVLTTLKRAGEPMSAYALLEKLEAKDIKGPPVVYRALKQLTQTGKVHKIHATGQYIACNCTESHDHALSVLTVCMSCRQVEELHDHTVIHHLEKLRGMRVCLPNDAVIELPVTCTACR